MQQASLILHVGDFTARAVLDDLERLTRVEAVHGNMDEADLRTALPERRIVEAEGNRIGLVHDAGPAAGRQERLIAWFPGCDVVSYGHTHVQELTQVGDTWIVNPGSPTERRRSPRHSLAVITDGAPQLVYLD